MINKLGGKTTGNFFTLAMRLIKGKSKAEQRKAEQRRRAKEGGMEYVGVRFEGNGSKKWDGKETEVPAKTLVSLGEYTVEGLEKAEVHWEGGENRENLEVCCFAHRPRRPGYDRDFPGCYGELQHWRHC